MTFSGRVIDSTWVAGASLTGGKLKREAVFRGGNAVNVNCKVFARVASLGMFCVVSIYATPRENLIFVACEQ